MAVGTLVLSTEIAVKAHRPAPVPPNPAAAATFDVFEELAHRASLFALPEEISAELLIESIVQIESGGDPLTVGSKGERGLMQIMAGTWAETTERLYGKALPFKQAFDPMQNRQVGTAYLTANHTFLQQHRGQWKSDERSLLLACYNAGPGRVAAAGFNVRRLPASTRDYIQRASALHDAYLDRFALRLEPGSERGSMALVRTDDPADS
jgi:soluble lytic murein transglycosylase-like protein